MSRATFNELLIAEVAKRPILWDVKSKHIRIKQKKMILRKEVAEILKEVDESVTADELQARWKNLKDTFRKKMKRKKSKRAALQLHRRQHIGRTLNR